MGTAAGPVCHVAFAGTGHASRRSGDTDRYCYKPALPLSTIHPSETHLYILRAIELRERLLVAEKFLDDSKDRYITVRESFRQIRNFAIYDGNPPEDDEFFDEFFEEEDLEEEQTQ